MQKMFRGIGGLALTGFLATAVLPAFAADKAENQLVGVKLWRGFKDVLAKHGPPTRIEIGAVSTPAGPMQGGGAEMGGAMMGGPSMGGPMGRMGGGGGKMGAMMGGGGSPYGGGGLPGVSGGGGMMGMMMSQRGPSAGGMMSGGGSPYGGGRMGGLGRGKGDGGEGGDVPLMGMGGGAPGGFGLPSGGGIGGDGLSAVGSGAEGEVTWIYDRPGALTYMFLFNKDGRVIQIQEYGYNGGGPTGAGIKLGDPVSRVYSIYGWAGASNKSGNQLTLDYSQKHHVAFQLLDQGKGPKVIGITLAITERGQIPGQ